MDLLIGLDSILRDRLEDTTLLAQEFLQCRHFLHTRFEPSLLEFRTLGLVAELQNHSVGSRTQQATGSLQPIIVVSIFFSIIPR